MMGDEEDKKSVNIAISVCFGNVLTILLFFFIYMNVRLLGDYSFVFFLAFITSVVLRGIRCDVEDELEEAIFNKPGSLLKNTYLVMFFTSLFGSERLS